MNQVSKTDQFLEEMTNIYRDHMSIINEHSKPCLSSNAYFGKTVLVITTEANVRYLAKLKSLQQKVNRLLMEIEGKEIHPDFDRKQKKQEEKVKAEIKRNLGEEKNFYYSSSIQLDFGAYSRNNFFVKRKFVSLEN